MRLLHTSTLELSIFDGRDIPPYAILSHTWGNEEVTFQDMGLPIPLSVVQRKGFQKISRACGRALDDGFVYIWIDTCCIDKSSSAELTEAINSMYNWYQRARICYAYLVDVSKADSLVPEHPELQASRWFTRGWTLQELLAPSNVIFLASDWTEYGEKKMLSSSISAITSIDREVLLGHTPLHAVSVAKRMSWASKRQTKRDEDIAYCLLGVFGINMPMLYGEGSRAFIRLQEEILKEIDDQSLLAWGYEEEMKESRLVGVFADSPAAFAASGNIVPCQPFQNNVSPVMTNRGLRLELPLCPISGFRVEELCYAMLQCRIDDDFSHVLAIPLARILTSKNDGRDFFRVEQAQPRRIPQTSWWSPENRIVHIRKHVQRTTEDTVYNFGFGVPPRLLVRNLPRPSQGYRIVAQYPSGAWDPRLGNFRMSLDPQRFLLPQAGFIIADRKGHYIAVLFGYSLSLFTMLMMLTQYEDVDLGNFQELGARIRRGALKPRTVAQELKHGLPFGPSQVLPPLIDNSQKLQPWCHVVRLDITDDADLKMQRKHTASDNRVAEVLERLASRSGPWWPTTKIKLEKDHMEVKIKEEVLMGKTTYIADIHCYTNDEYLKMRGKRLSALVVLTVMLLTEWVWLSEPALSFALIPIVAMFLDKLAFWSDDGYTFYWKVVILWVAHFVPLSQKLLKIDIFKMYILNMRIFKAVFRLDLIQMVSRYYWMFIPIEYMSWFVEI